MAPRNGTPDGTTPPDAAQRIADFFRIRDDLNTISPGELLTADIREVLTELSGLRAENERHRIALADALGARHTKTADELVGWARDLYVEFGKVLTDRSKIGGDLVQARRDLEELRARFGISEHVGDNRCPSCEHRIHMHGPDGCLQEIGYGPGDEPCCCPCTTGGVPQAGTGPQPGDRAALLRLAASGRREYAEGISESQTKASLSEARAALLIEAETLDSAARVIDGDDNPLYGWLPSVRWDEIPTSRPAGTGDTAQPGDDAIDRAACDLHRWNTEDTWHPRFVIHDLGDQDEDPYVALVRKVAGLLAAHPCPSCATPGPAMSHNHGITDRAGRHAGHAGPIDLCRLCNPTRQEPDPNEGYHPWQVGLSPEMRNKPDMQRMQAEMVERMTPRQEPDQDTKETS